MTKMEAEGEKYIKHREKCVIRKVKNGLLGFNFKCSKEKKN